jgi:histidine phosphotransferase ChpT
VGVQAGPAGSRGAARIKIGIICRGKSARIPEGVADVFAGKEAKVTDTKLVVAYYAWRLASQSHYKIGVAKEGDDAVFTVEPK